MADLDKSGTNQQEQDGNIVYLWKIPFDRTFIKSISSILRIAAAILSLIAFCCVASGRSDNCDDDYASTYNYFEFVSISAFLTLLANWLLFALTICTRQMFKFVPWKLGDFIILAVFALLYLIANICVAAQDCGKDSNRAGAAFGFFTLFCIVAAGVLSGRAWLAQRNEARRESSNAQANNAERNIEQY